jgi:exopolyphosphatase/pppGpp-phosphohydrolase
MKIAGIDIGSNTILMQIIDLYREDNDFFLITVLREEQGIARLAENFSKKKIINESSINKAEETLKKFRKI